MPRCCCPHYPTQPLYRAPWALIEFKPPRDQYCLQSSKRGSRELLSAVLALHAHSVPHYGQAAIHCQDQSHRTDLLPGVEQRTRRIVHHRDRQSSRFGSGFSFDACITLRRIAVDLSAISQLRYRFAKSLGEAAWRTLSSRGLDISRWIRPTEHPHWCAYLILQ